MKKIISFLCTLAISMHLYGQKVEIKHKARDQQYIKDFYKTHLIIRAYESSRFNNFKLLDDKGKVIYKPNQHNDIGLGFTYKVISVSFEFFIPFLSQNSDTYGATHSFDVQTYVYYHNFLFDFYSQFYNGYHLDDGNTALAGNQPDIVKRPDITTKDISLLCQYVFNGKRFSFDGPFNQNEIQKKNAGSFLLGGGIYHNDGHADSSFIPSAPRNPGFFDGYRFHGFSYTGIGANLGYAYTAVIRKHFFVMGAMTAGAGIGDAVVSGNSIDSRIGAEYMAEGKFAAGYTNDKYFAGVTYVRLITEINSVAPGSWEQESTGNFRFTIAKRFRLKKEILPSTQLIKID